MSKKYDPQGLFAPVDTFVRRHIGSSDEEIQEMLETVGYDSLDALVDAVIPEEIRIKKPLNLGPPRGERELLAELKEIARQNKIYRSYIGMGYYNCVTPSIILRNILENPGWYTQYTPYQAEISQGRLEALINFQTMITDLTGFSLANSSLLDEATAAAEAMNLAYNVARKKRKHFFVAEDTHPQTLAVLQTRAKPLGITLTIGDPSQFDFGDPELFGVFLQYPTSKGYIEDYSDIIEKAHSAKALVIVAADLLALTLLKPPAEWGADIAVGTTQRFGVPLGFGGPHAGYMALSDKYKRQMPGRLIGLSKDAFDKPGFRLTLQTREQHIRRDKATSNICTAQVLLAIMAGMYAVYHGADGLREIAGRIHAKTKLLAQALRQLNFKLSDKPFFDTLFIELDPQQTQHYLTAALAKKINLRAFEEGGIGISLDETTTLTDLQDLIAIFAQKEQPPFDIQQIMDEISIDFGEKFTRTSDFLTHEIFKKYHTEHELLRYLTRLQAKDLSLTTSMIPLGSCTMKLNGTSEMIPITWPEFTDIHPFVPADQAQGYLKIIEDLEKWLAEITGFAATSLQPNAGSQGEYSGLLVVRRYHEERGESHRNICLIPVSAHGTNPASAVMAGHKVVTVACNERGDIDVADLEEKAKKYRDNLSALMITYPSTHGVFEQDIVKICDIIHENGGLVYMDGANMNAQVGLCRPGDFGADLCHLNLHKTFGIPHGGGGPGVGPIAVSEKLADYLPGHPVIELGSEKANPPVSASPYGSPNILPISWMYIALMGAEGLKKASQVAILNANYMAKRLEKHFNILYKGNNDLVAHEFILDLRPFKHTAHIDAVDVAKRLMDYSFHAPTMSWPVPGTLMTEPTESESKEELDRFCDAMIQIRQEIQDIIDEKTSLIDNPLINAPHPVESLLTEKWEHPYPREEAAYPLPWVRERKFWPVVGRIDDAHGDRNLFCVCPPLQSYN